MDLDIAEEDACRLLSRCRQVSQRMHLYRKRSEGEWDAMREEIASVNQSIKETSLKVESLKEDVTGRLHEILLDCTQAFRNGPGGDLRQHLKGTKRPIILSLLLGKNCPVQAVRREEAFKIKDDYHKFRSSVAQMMLLSSTLLVLALWHADRAAGTLGGHGRFIAHSFSPIIMVSVQVFLTHMIYVYMAMAARESMLLMNGSHIRSWWILHHYLSAVTCMITLALPVDSPRFQSYIRGWLHWTIMQSVLMLAQNRYQRKRMYTRIALGKNSAMDVVGGETSGMPGQLLALLPGLFSLQVWQIYLGIDMARQTYQSIIDPEGWLDGVLRNLHPYLMQEMERHETDLRASRGIFLVGIMMTGMGLLNAFYTIRTVVAKSKAAASRAKTQ